MYKSFVEMKLFSWGANSHGQLSQGFLSEQCLQPAEAQNSHQFDENASMAGGGSHTLVLNSDGSVFGAGSNTCGQIADCENNTTVLSTLKSLQEFRLCQVECGWDSSHALTDCGSVVAWGSNRHGQLGISKAKVTSTKHPVTIECPEPIVQVAAGLRHTVLVSSRGSVFVCGQGDKGQLGVTHLSGDKKAPPKDVDYLVRVPGLDNVEKVACGQHHTLALTQDGCLYGWGDNRRGQLGEGADSFLTPHLIMTLAPDAVIRAGWTHSAVLSSGTVTTWGRNNYSQLGHSCGQEQVNKPQQISGLKGVKQLELGSEHNLALLENGEVWSWGWNEHGNCGTGTVANVPTPQLVSVPSPVTFICSGAGHSLAFTAT